MREQPSVIDRFVEYYTGLDNKSIPALAGLYDTHAVLIDPFGDHNGLFAIQRYFTHLLANVSDCRFVIDPPLGDTQRFAVTWTMYWSHPRIASGEIRDLPGCSMVEIQGEKIIRQRDYYDAGQMIYEHLPLLGWVVRVIKGRVGA